MNGLTSNRSTDRPPQQQQPDDAERRQQAAAPGEIALRAREKRAWRLGVRRATGRGAVSSNGSVVACAISRSPARGADGRRARRTPASRASRASRSSGSVDRHDLAHAARIGRQHQHLLAEEGRLVDRVGDEQDRRAGLRQMRRSSSLRRSRVISSSAPNGSSISRSCGSADQRAGDRDALAHAARQLVRIAPAPSPSSPTSSSSSRGVARAGRACRRRPRAAARRSAAPCATAAAPRPGTRSRSRGAARAACGASPSTRICPLLGVDQVGDHAQQRRLAAARRAEQREEARRAGRRGRRPRSAVTVRRSVMKRTRDALQRRRRPADAATDSARERGGMSPQPTFARAPCVAFEDRRCVITSSSLGVRGGELAELAYSAICSCQTAGIHGAPALAPWCGR